MASLECHASSKKCYGLVNLDEVVFGEDLTDQRQT